MRSWLTLLSGLIIWTVHFFSLYVIASVFLTTPIARVLALLVSTLCLGSIGLLLWWVTRRGAASAGQWLRTVALYTLSVSALAVLWQSLPAILL